MKTLYRHMPYITILTLCRLLLPIFVPDYDSIFQFFSVSKKYTSYIIFSITYLILNWGCSIHINHNLNIWIICRDSLTFFNAFNEFFSSQCYFRRIFSTCLRIKRKGVKGIEDKSKLNARIDTSSFFILSPHNNSFIYSIY